MALSIIFQLPLISPPHPAEDKQPPRNHWVKTSKQTQSFPNNHGVVAPNTMKNSNSSSVCMQCFTWRKWWEELHIWFRLWRKQKLTLHKSGGTFKWGAKNNMKLYSPQAGFVKDISSEQWNVVAKTCSTKCHLEGHWPKMQFKIRSKIKIY